MEFISDLFEWLAHFFGTAVEFGQYVQSNIVILLIAVVVFAIAAVILRSLFKILLFIPVLILATYITIWVVNSLTETPVTPEEIPTLLNT